MVRKDHRSLAHQGSVQRNASVLQNQRGWCSSWSLRPLMTTIIIIQKLVPQAPMRQAGNELVRPQYPTSTGARNRHSCPGGLSQDQMVSRNRGQPNYTESAQRPPKKAWTVISGAMETKCALHLMGCGPGYLLCPRTLDQTTTWKLNWKAQKGRASLQDRP